MKFGFTSLCVAAFTLCCGFLSAVGTEDQLVDPSTKLVFPKEVTFSSGGHDYHLSATGVATRKKFIVKVYSVAHYLQDPAAIHGSDKFQAILDSDQAKQLTLQFDRALTPQQIQEAYRESLEKEMSQSEQKQLQPQIDAFIKLFSNGMKKGDEQVMRWLPDGQLEILVNGNLLSTIGNAQFAKFVWAIWLGSHSVVDRNALISLLP